MSKDSGLVHAYELQENRQGKAVDWSHVRQWTPEQGLLWVHLDYNNEHARQWLLAESGLDPIVFEALVAVETRPRVLAFGESLLLILRGVNCNPGADPAEMVSLRMWFEKNRIITMRHRRVMAADDIHQRIGRNEGPVSLNEFLIWITQNLVNRMGDVISEIDDKVDALEELVLTAESYAIRSQLAQIRRQSIGLRRYIAPQRDVLMRLHNERIPWLTDRDRGYLRESAERTARFVEDIDAARDRAAITQEELNSRLSEQMNKTMYVLSIVTGIFLPLGLITGLLGVNVGGIPGAGNSQAFVILLVILSVIAVAQYFFFKRQKIL